MPRHGNVDRPPPHAAPESSPLQGLTGFTDELRRDLLELVEDRQDRRSLVITSQFPVEKWHELIGDPTLADAILDRIVHKAHKITMRGGSMRKARSSDPETDHPG